MKLADGPIIGKTAYSADDDAAIVQYIRENLDTVDHPLGTCKMGLPEDIGVGE